MLRELAAASLTSAMLAEPFAISLAAASKHSMRLERGLIRRGEVRGGRTHLCSSLPDRSRAAHSGLSFYERFWTDRRMARTAPPPAENATPPKKETTDDISRPRALTAC